MAVPTTVPPRNSRGALKDFLESLRAWAADADTKLASRLKQNVVAGAGANTDIAVAGIVTGDQIIGVVELPGPGEAAGQVPQDRTAQTTIQSAGNIRVSVATNTSADRRLIVTWLDKT